MKKLENILAENMRRFGTKNLNEQQLLSCNLATDGIKNVIPEMVSSPPFPGQLNGNRIQGKFNGVAYEWNGQDVDGFPTIRGMAPGEILTENNSFLTRYNVTDASSNGVWVGFAGAGENFACYLSTNGQVKCVDLSDQPAEVAPELAPYVKQ